MNDTLKELWFQIDQTHSRYIEADNCPVKIEYEKKLGGLIRDYLSLVPHNFKFRFDETSQALKCSILSNEEDFNSYKLVNAWLAIAKYANNLLSQPWRKEYFCIKLYSGFYKHQIESVLIGGKTFLALMGYKESEPGHMRLYEAIDEENVRMVALDALIAMVEVQELRNIFENVCQQINSCSWKEVIECRETYSGTSEIISRKLVNKYYQRQYRPTSQSCSYHQPVAYNGCGPSIPVPVPPYMTMQSSHGCPSAAPNGYYCHHYAHNSTMPINYSWSVPSGGGNLIDFDPPAYRNTPSDSYSRSLTSSDEQHRNRLKEDWGYVLEKLDKPSDSSVRKYSSTPSNNTSKINESMKHLRLEKQLIDDVDNEKSSKSHEVRETFVKANRNRERNYSGTNDTRVPATSAAVIDAASIHTLDRSDRHRSRMDKSKAISPDIKYDGSLSDTKRREKFVNQKVQTCDTADSSNQRVSLEGVCLRVNLTPEVSKPSSSHWDCEFCTYRNETKRDICEMCNRSRNSGIDLKPLESGGSQCTKCTLVNEKGVVKCKACDESLENSPTYI